MSKARLKLDVIVESDDSDMDAHDLAEAGLDWFFDTLYEYPGFVGFDTRLIELTVEEE